MTQPLSFRDAEQLSAYLDNQSSQADRQRLDARLKNEPELRGLLAELSQARTLLRSLPARKAPRNFRLTPEMAGIRPPIPRAFPVFRFASALAAVLLFFAFAANLTFPALSALQAAAPAPAMPAAGLASKFAAPLQPAAPAAGIEAAPTLGDAAALQPAATSAGIGGGPTGADTAAPQATEPVRLFAPQTLATSDLTATPETSLMLPAPTQTPEMAATEAPTQAGDMTRNSAADLNTPQPETARPEPLRPLVPAWLQFGLLGLAVISAGAAYFTRARADQTWLKAHALPFPKPTTRQMIAFILIILLVIALAVGIGMLSSAGFYAP